MRKLEQLEKRLERRNKKFPLCEEHEAWQILAEIDEVEGRIDMLLTGNPPSFYGFRKGATT